MSLVVEGASKTWAGRGRDPVRALNDVHLQVAEGELVVLVGPSGSGKTTLLRAVAGLEALDDGRVRIAAVDVTRAPPGDRSVALVFQDLALFPHLTVADNIGFGARARGGAAPAVRDAVLKAARALHIETLLDRRPAELSGGERQRVALARALLRDPALFLLDEPLSSVDAELRVRLREEVKDLQRRTGVAMVHVTHDQAEAMALADRVVVLVSGAVAQAGPPEDLWHRPATLGVARMTGDLPLTVLEAGWVGEQGDHVVALRADDLDLVPAGEGNLDMVVTDVVLDGARAVVRGRSAHGAVHVRCGWADRPAEGAALAVTWPPGAEHRFAADSGVRLA
jgi:ABC-type sugar transport system ATPase subunit